MQHPAFAGPGRWFKGNIHGHSNRSDGALEPAAAVAKYADAGYDFVSLTDHLVGEYGYPITDTRDFRTNAFTTIPGAEIHTGAMRNGELWHMVAVGLPEDFAPPRQPTFEVTEESESAASLARRAADAGAFVSLAHPDWFNMMPEDAAAVDAAHAVEVYNHTCWLECDRGRGHYLSDALASAGRMLSITATDDSHWHHEDGLGGWVMVRAEANEPEALVAAMRAGHVYGSTGPEIHDVAVDGDALVVRSSPAARVMALGHGSACTNVFATSEPLTETRLPLDPFREGGWVRVTVVDAEDCPAWTAPMRL